jgi:hypothetical protein
MTKTTIGSIRWIQFRQLNRHGVLSVFEGNDPHGVPFPIARVFTIAAVPSGGRRGNHAHRHCSQLLVCLSGGIEVFLDDGLDMTSIAVKADAKALLIPPLLWNTVMFKNPSTVLMVFCNEPYDPGDYIRDRDEYLRLKRAVISPSRTHKMND